MQRAFLPGRVSCSPANRWVLHLTKGSLTCSLRTHPRLNSRVTRWNFRCRLRLFSPLRLQCSRSFRSQRLPVRRPTCLVALLSLRPRPAAALPVAVVRLFSPLVTLAHKLRCLRPAKRACLLQPGRS